jgi:hypothetical protein
LILISILIITDIWLWLFEDINFLLKVIEVQVLDLSFIFRLFLFYLISYSVSWSVWEG